MLNTNITLPINTIRAYCDILPIRKLSLFGSVLSDNFTVESDVDILVEFEPDSGITYFDLYDIQQTLSQMIGREVDLLTPNALSDYFRDDVLNTAQVIYEASN